jgi:acetylornithine deacetylase/succinyl-diaminopimelate desuccinylase-like protein
VSQVLDLLQELIGNACVNDGTVGSGRESKSVASLIDFFGVSGEVFEPAPGRQSLIYRIKGSDPGAPSLALAPHLDVVPADSSGWATDPFVATIRDGLVFGRGAVDMLNVTASMAVAVRPYIRGELRPTGDLIFVALADEESGGRFGAAPLVEEHWGLVGADYLLTEVAYPGIEGAREPAVPVSVGEKGPFWSILRATGTPGHGSAPYGADNALAKIVHALEGIFSSGVPAELTGVWLGFVDALGLDPEIAGDLKDVDRLDSAIDLIASENPLLARYIHAATHLTISPNLVVGGTKTNTIADHARAELDIRALPGFGRRDVDVHLRKVMGSGSDHVEIEPIMDFEANVSGHPTPLWDAIADSVDALEGHRRLIPTLMTVTTDARFWRAKGTVAYGVGLFDDRIGFAKMLSLFHGNNECVSIDSVERTTLLYREILARFNAA